MRASVREEVSEILRASATTTLLVTHDQDEALSLADLVAVLRDGRIAQCATPQDLYARPVDDELARFVGDANLIDGVLDGDARRHAARQAPRPWHGEPLPTRCPVTVLIRPEQIDLHPSRRRGGPRRTDRALGLPRTRRRPPRADRRRAWRAAADRAHRRRRTAGVRLDSEAPCARSCARVGRSVAQRSRRLRLSLLMRALAPRTSMTSGKIGSCQTGTPRRRRRGRS